MRALSQPIFIIDKEWHHFYPPHDIPGLTLTIAGVTDDYSVVIESDHMCCSCPDFARNCHLYPCKHVLYVLIQVLKIPVIASNNFSIDYALAFQRGAALVKKAVEPAENQHNDEDCCICYMAIEAAPTRQCKTCKHLIHRECMRVWLRQKQSCPLCRSHVDANEDHKNNWVIAL
jgi:hypothetical protein